MLKLNTPSIASFRLGKVTNERYESSSPFSPSSFCPPVNRAKMMHMTFYWSRYVTLLVDSWRTDSWPSYVLSLVACFLFSAFYQYMEDRRIRLKTVAASLKSSPPPLSSENAAAVSSPLLLKIGGARPVNAASLATAMLFGVNSAVGYLLMLAVMSFNGGVFLAIVSGLTVGYYSFRSGVDEVSAAVDNPCACA